MSSIIKLENAKIILEKELSILLKSLSFEPKLARIHIILRDNIQIFVRYNNYEEYSYTLIFSKVELDRCRFDNYDDKWNVITRPNHFPPRYDESGYSSPMRGKPVHDLPVLINLLKTGKLLSKDINFD